MAEVTSDLYRTVERTVGGLGYQLVDVERLGGGLLRVSLDTDNGVGLEDCERVSRQLSHLFAVEQVDYQRLEVSSPGLDRRLRSAADFARFVGKEIKIQLVSPSAAAGGRKRLQGRVLELVSADSQPRLQVQLSADDGAASGTGTRAHRSGKSKARVQAEPAIVEVALADIDKARLVPELNFRPARKTEAIEIGNAGSLGANVHEP